MFAEIYAPPPRLLVYGAVDTAEALCEARAKLLGWHGDRRRRAREVRDARADPERDEIIVAWPEEAIEQVAPDHATAIVVLTHDDKFDIPALKAALETEAFYVGALGSRRNQERRRERLLEAGVEEAELERISGPCGLDIGAETQPETALSILAEIVAVRERDARAASCRHRRQRIHVRRWPEMSREDRARRTSSGGRSSIPIATRSSRRPPPEPPWSGELNSRPRGRRLPLRRVRRRAVPLRREVRVGLRVAELLPAGRRGRGRARGGRLARHAPDRGPLRRHATRTSATSSRTARRRPASATASTRSRSSSSPRSRPSGRPTASVRESCAARVTPAFRDCPSD